MVTLTDMSGNATGPAVPSSGESIDSEEAAGLLGVAADVLRGWSERLAFPTAIDDGGARRYPLCEIEALHSTLPSSHSVEGAVRAAQQQLGR